MTSTTHAVGQGRPLHTRPFFDMLTVRLVSYRHVWRTKDDYVYECTWSDGEQTTEVTLPWGNLGDAVGLS